MATVAMRLVTAAGFSKPTISSRIVILHFYLNLKMSVFGLKEIMLNSATAFKLCWDRHYDLEKTRADWPGDVMSRYCRKRATHPSLNCANKEKNVDWAIVIACV